MGGATSPSRGNNVHSCIGAEGNARDYAEGVTNRKCTTVVAHFPQAPAPATGTPF